MRAIALLAAHNEERFLPGCLEHLAKHGLETYIIDNGSTDATREIAETFRGRGVIGIESVPHRGVYSWRPILERKAELASELDADWFLHADPDERHLPPEDCVSLVEAFAAAEDAGATAINFRELTFTPTREQPDHDHARYAETMDSYYAFQPQPIHRVNAWRKPSGQIDLTQSGGHAVMFSGRRIHPTSFPMLHYLFLSPEHAVRKYVRRTYDPAELAVGWHRARAALTESRIGLSSAHELRSRRRDGLDASHPFACHPLFAAVGAR